MSKGPRKDTDGLKETQDTLPLKKGSVSGSNVVGSENDARLKLYDQIADSAEAARSDEMKASADSDPVDEAEDEQEPDETASPDSGDEREQIADGDDETTDQVDQNAQPTPEAKKYKLKVNGQDREFSEEEILARASKVESADQYLAEAVKAAKTVKQQAPTPSEEDALEKVEQDDLALARAIQMGSEEEAVKAIRALRTRPSVNQDDVLRLVDERLTFQKAYASFQDAHKELFADPNLRRLVALEDDRLVAEGFDGHFTERWEKAAKTVADWKAKFTTPVARSEKEQRKASVVSIRSASARASAAPDEEPDDSPANVIADMAKARGQRI